MSATGKAVDKATGHLHREARFADSTGTRDRDQAHILTQQEFFGGSYFLLPPHEPGPLHRKIGRAGLYLLGWLVPGAVAEGSKFPREISGSGVTLIGLFSQAPLDSPAQRGGSVAV